GVSLADVIVTDSDNTRRDVINAFSVPESKVLTVYPGHGMLSGQESSAPEESFERINGRKYLLFLGAISEKKNTERIVRAYADSKAKSEFDLVMVGILSYRHELTIDAIRELGIEKHVKMLGYVSDNEVMRILRNASGFVFPTLYEGFGFPILEAMMVGVPVLTSNIGSAVEVSGGHAKLTDPYETEAITAGIDYLVEPGNFDLVAAKKHAEQFTWTRCARELLSIYETL
ncbi:MAG: glycosyltransferase family 4 protein, partial [Acidobacteriota bacterium]|nr:glycosyltransferase family 4 protein [Acidobacteriota bacterium]